jgi:hypothetical protein
MRIFRKISLFFHDLFFPRNVVRIKTLDRHWVDADELLLHGLFAIFVDFYENEYMKSCHNHDIDVDEMVADYIKDGYDPDFVKIEIGNAEHHNLINKQLLELYNFWTVTRPAREKEHNKNWKYEQGEKNDLEDNQKMHELIELRRTMWT